MFSLPKMESIFSIITTLNKLQYKFKNGTILKLSEKLIIIIINLLICYLIIKISYVRLLLIIKLIFIGIEFEVPRETNCIYDSSTKLRREIKSS